MKNLKTFAAFMLFAFTVPVITAQPGNDRMLEQIIGLKNEVTQNCNKANFNNFVQRRNDLLNNVDAVAENYRRSRAMFELDQALMTCANASIAEAEKAAIVAPSEPQITRETVRVEVPVVSPADGGTVLNPTPTPVPSPDSDCTDKVLYTAIGGSTAIILLIIALLNALKTKKWLEELIDKLHDKILDYFTDQIFGALGLEEDEKYKKKIKQLKELNQDRMRRKITVKAYLVKVDDILDKK